MYGHDHASPAPAGCRTRCTSLISGALDGLPGITGWRPETDGGTTLLTMRGQSPGGPIAVRPISR
jgi:hypothetical protein